MNKESIIKQTAKNTALHPAIVEAVVSSMYELMADAIDRREDVLMPGVGAIRFLTTKAKVARNPITNEPYYLGEDLRIKFKPTMATRQSLVRKRITKEEYEAAKAAEQNK